MATPILETRNLKKYFKTARGNLHAVDDIHLSIERGRTLGVVGESGCGKSTLGRVILRLIEATGGEILYEGRDLRKLSNRHMEEMRKELQIIFQDPFASLNPRLSVSEVIADPISTNKLLTGKAAIQERVVELMRTVGLSERFINAYPHELDGGRRQRIGVARALALNPKFIVCDEPVSALDVSVQAQILNLMMDLQEERELTYLFITHDMSVVKHISDHIMVMYMGQCVESAKSDELFDQPMHPYTQALLSAIPVPRLRSDRGRKHLVRGEVTSPVNPQPGCRFSPRCPHAGTECTGQVIPLTKRSQGHYVSCVL